MALTRVEYVNRLLNLGRRHGEIPLYGSAEWEALPGADPRKFAAVVRAAESWRLDGEPDVMQARITDELALNDQLAAWRLRRMSGDLAELPLQRAHDIDIARRKAGDFRYRKEAA